MPRAADKRHLRFAGLQSRTLTAYRAAIERYMDYATENSIQCHRARHLDESLAEYLNTCYQEGEPLAYAGHLLSGLKRFHPNLRLKLPIASQFYRNWQRCHTPQRAVPLSWHATQALIGVALEAGCESLALLWFLGFVCLLRTSEMTGLKRCHILLHDHFAVSVIIQFSKTSRGNAQVVSFCDQNLFSLAQRVKQAGSSQSLIWPHSVQSFRSVFQGCLNVLRFPPAFYLPYSLRRGGATWWFQSTRSLDETVHRGRWACQKTAKIYVDDGLLVLAQLAWSKRQRRAVRKYAKLARTSFDRLRQ